MKFVSTVLLCLGINLILDTGGRLVSAQNPNRNLKCLDCNMNRNVSCVNPPKRDWPKISRQCSDLFGSNPNQAANTTNSTQGGETFPADWESDRDANGKAWKATEWVCVKQEVYATSKNPPGVGGGGKWNARPFYVTRVRGKTKF